MRARYAKSRLCQRVAGSLLVLAMALGCDHGSESAATSSMGAGGADSGAAGAASDAGCVAPNDLQVDGLFSDEALLNRDPPPELPVYVFSQSDPSSIDPQLFEVGAAVSLRTTNQWGASGTSPEDYATDRIQELKSTGTRVILGLTAGVVFASQFDSDAEFLELVTRDVTNQPVKHDEIVPDAYRGNLAHPKFRDLVVENAKTLIDVGADGIFFDEANSGHAGAQYDGNEGFDNQHEADFRTYLCAKHPDWTPASFRTQFDTSGENTLNCSVQNCVGSSFSVRRYIEDQGLDFASLLESSALLAEWGTSVINRLSASPTSFLQTYEIAYWADIVRRVRQYARKAYQREILVTSNGLFPFVDFQSVGLYSWNPDAPDGSVANYVHYVPTTLEGHLDAKVPLFEDFQRLRARSQALAGDVPVVLFLDWPTDMISAYYAFSIQEKRDYFRIYGAEAYAAGLRFAWHIKTSLPGDPTATDSSMLDWFTDEAEFYRQNAALYVGARPSSVTATTSIENVVVTTTQLANGRLAVHLINHDYDEGLVPRASVVVSVQTEAEGSTAVVTSPDADAVASVALTVAKGTTKFELTSLTSYAVVVIQ